MSVNIYDEIIPNLFLGGYKALENYQLFDLIINCTKDIIFPENTNTHNIDTSDIDTSIRYIRLPVNDEPNEVNKLQDLLDNNNILEIINLYLGESKKVLVHCKMGQQRSAIIVVCYLCKYHNMKSNHAIGYVKMKRPIAFFGQINFKTILNNFD